MSWTNLTSMAAVAACETIEEVSGQKPESNGVNDIYIDGRKVSGILTEASISMENGSVEYVVVGIGFNVYLPEDGFSKLKILPEPSLTGRRMMARTFLWQGF